MDTSALVALESYIDRRMDDGATASELINEFKAPGIPSYELLGRTSKYGKWMSYNVTIDEIREKAQLLISYKISNRDQ